MGRIEIRGPTRSHDSSRPQRMSLTKKHSTVLLVNACQKIQTPKAHHPREKNKERMTSNFYSLQTGYHNPLRGQEKKRKTVASATAAEPKGKKMKVLTHWPRYIKPDMVPKFGAGISSAAEAKRVAPIV
jgi:hypothetical protein